MAPPMQVLRSAQKKQTDAFEKKKPYKVQSGAIEKKKPTPRATTASALAFFRMSLHERTPKTKKPELLYLPPEIQMHIISFLSNEPTPDSPEATLTYLRRTHSSFRKVIPIQPFRGTNLSVQQRRLMAIQLLGAEHRVRNPDLYIDHYYPCYKCLRVRNAGYFPFSEADMVRRNMDIGASRAHMRQCMDCSGIFRPGEPKNFWEIDWWRQFHM